MKLFNIFKKKSSSNSQFQNVSAQKMSKSQLEKVIGGAGPDIPNEVQGPINTTRSNIKTPTQSK